MNMDDYFIVRKPKNHFLSTIVDYYFHINISTSILSLTKELIIPFPRINFLYFFNHPFLVTNQTVNEAVLATIAISKISTDKIIVQPKSNMVKIIGAHVQPFCLAYFTKKPIHTLPC